MNQRLTFDDAVTPHSLDWRDAQVHRAGWEFNQPLVAKVMAAHAGTLPKRWGWLEMDHPALVVSALKPGRRGGAVLRVFEATGKATGRVRARLHAPARAVHEVNLMEDEGRSLNIENSGFSFELRPHEIKSFRIQ
jgi:alpha-mannosidase